MSRYPEHAAWVGRTGLLMPWLPTLVRSLPEVFRTESNDDAGAS